MRNYDAWPGNTPSNKGWRWACLAGCRWFLADDEAIEARRWLLPSGELNTQLRRRRYQ
ncbi:MAG: hypothetical protein U0074_02735 [Kouleothrix sp.]